MFSLHHERKNTLSETKVIFFRNNYYTKKYNLKVQHNNRLIHTNQ